MKQANQSVAVVCCNGGSPLQAGLGPEVYAADCSAIRAAHPDGLYACRYACLGGGSCVSACPIGAISLDEKQLAKVDDLACTGCGLCAETCPQQLIRMVPAENVIRVLCSNQESGPISRKNCSVSCIACGMCEKNCPADAIHVIDNCAVIDQSLCIACGMCAVKCPRRSIVDADGVLS